MNIFCAIRTIYQHMKPYRTILSHMLKCEIIMRAVSPDVDVWSYMGQYEP